MIFDPNSPPQKNLKGQLLLADPSLRDGAFLRSVILVHEHDTETGASGLILNHPSEHQVGDLLKNKEFQALANLPVFIGGPVSKDQLTFSAFWWNADGTLHQSTRVSSKEAILLTQKPDVLVKAFAGYSGWEAGQLEKELSNNAWIISTPSPPLLKNSHCKQLWAETLRGMSAYHKLIAETPLDPFAN